MAQYFTKREYKDRVASRQITGDAARPDEYDLLAQTINLPMGQEPKGTGWRVLTGNSHNNLWARVCYRYEHKADIK